MAHASLLIRMKFKKRTEWISKSESVSNQFFQFRKIEESRKTGGWSKTCTISRLRRNVAHFSWRTTGLCPVSRIEKKSKKAFIIGLFFVSNIFECMCLLSSTCVFTACCFVFTVCVYILARLFPNTLIFPIM